MSKANLAFHKIQVILKDKEFISKHRLSINAFTRKRKLPLEIVVGTLIHLAKRSLQIECNLLSNFLKIEGSVSKQAFSQARHKISVEGFIELNNQALEVFYTDSKDGIYKGFRLIAVDSSTIRLPDAPEIVDYFERWDKGDNLQKKCPPIARISEFIDMASGIVLSARFASCRQGEEGLAQEQLVEVVDKMNAWRQPKMLFVYDRGYPSKKFFKDHFDKGVHFLFRIPNKFNKQIEEILESSLDDVIIKLYEDLPQLRVLIYSLASGEKEILLTNMTDTKSYSYEEFFNVYGMRWGTMEEGYKKQKASMELANFLGESVLAVNQEFWALIIAMNILSMYCIETEGYLSPNEIPIYRLNRNVLFGSLRQDILGSLTGEITTEYFENKFQKLAKRCWIKVKKGRSFSREKVGIPKRYTTYPRVC